MERIAGLLLALFALIGGAAAEPAQQNPFAHKPTIEITVLFPAGSSADITARLLADGISKELATNVIVVNRPGAGGAIGYRHVAGQKPDGTSLVWNSNSISTTFHSGTLAFDYKSFVAVAQVLTESPVVAVKSEAKWRTLKDLIADGKARPKAITVGNSGVGSHTHISSVALFRPAGVQAVDVPFAAAQVVPSLLGGQVDAVVQLPAALAQYHKSGQVRFLAAMVASRDPAFPKVPTAREEGFDVSLEAWRGIAVPVGTPAATVSALELAIRNTVASNEFVQACERLGARPGFLPSGQFGALIAKEDAMLAKLMDVIGLKKK
jgi:tripartite-type tricarboxylate transporter receptor subunit TctC